MIELISGNTPAQITDLNLEDIILRKQILSYLEKNSKMDPREIAILLGTEPDVVENEIRKMEEEKIICGYHTMIDWDKTSSEMVTALIEVRVTPQRGQGFDSIAERIYKYPEVRSVYLISGGYSGRQNSQRSFPVCNGQTFHPGLCLKYRYSLHSEEIQRSWYNL